MALGNVLRGRKQFAECADVYSKGVDTISKPEKSNWVIYYFRGICFERAKQWAKAEADLKTALGLFPDQPHVLNYLGYSWIDQGVNLDDGMRMIKRAVLQLKAALDDTTEGVTEMLHHTTFYVRVPKLHNCPNSQTVAGQRWQT